MDFVSQRLSMHLGEAVKERSANRLQMHARFSDVQQFHQGIDEFRSPNEAVIA